MWPEELYRYDPKVDRLSSRTQGRAAEAVLYSGYDIDLSPSPSCWLGLASSHRSLGELPNLPSLCIHTIWGKKVIRIPQWVCVRGKQGGTVKRAALHLPDRSQSALTVPQLGRVVPFSSLPRKVSIPGPGALPAFLPSGF